MRQRSGRWRAVIVDTAAVSLACASPYLGVKQAAPASKKFRPLIEAKARANLVESGERFGKGSENSHEPIERIRTDETLADMAGVSSNTIRKVERITQGGSVGAAPDRAGRQASTAVPAAAAATWYARRTNIRWESGFAWLDAGRHPRWCRLSLRSKTFDLPTTNNGLTKS